MKAPTNKIFLTLHFLIILGLGLQGCSKKDAPGMDNATSTEMAVTTDAVTEKSKPRVPGKHINNKIIKNASLRFQIADFDQSLKVIENQVNNYNGYIVSANENRRGDNLESTIIIKVPFQKLDTLIHQLVDQSIYLDYRNINTEDVSSEFIDISARINAKKAVEQRYLDLLKQAKSIGQILEIENQLRLIREEIESTQARINHINEHVAYSTINLEIYEKNAGYNSGSNSFLVRIWNALQSGWDIFLSFIVDILNLWPFLILLVLGVWAMKKFFRKYPPVS